MGVVSEHLGDEFYRRIRSKLREIAIRLDESGCYYTTDKFGNVVGPFNLISIATLWGKTRTVFIWETEELMGN